MSVRDTKNPNGGVIFWDYNEEPALNENLMERVLSPENMSEAWKRVKANKGVAGVDGMSIEEFPEFARNHWPSIRQDLVEEKYRPLPVKRVEILKPDGGKRPLGIAMLLS